MNNSNQMNNLPVKGSSVFRCLSLFFLLLSLSSVSFAQNDTPCECVQRWEEGAHWNEDGSINDDPNAPKPLGIIRCGSSAETQSQIKPGDCKYNPNQFAIDVETYPCIDPSTQKEVSAKNPTAGQPIIWLNLDVRPNAGSFQVQINDNSGDKIAWALYYSLSFEAGLNENGISGDCNTLLLAACGVESSNTWNTLPVPNFSQPTNYYLAIWDQNADGDLSVNNFKARFGCGDADILVCNLEAGEPTTDCQDDTYTVAVPIQGINGKYVGYDPNATPTHSAPVCLTNPGTTDVTSGTILMTYTKSVGTYNIQISIDDNPDDDCPDPIVPENCGAVVTGDAPVCCEAPEISCPADITIACEASIDPLSTGMPTVDKGCGEVTVEHNDVITAGLCVTETTILRTWTATDENGNVVSCEQMITVEDNTAPLPPAAPEEITVSCVSLVPEMPELVAMDNCVGAVVGLPSSSITGENCGNNFTIERVWTFSDECGNTSSVSQIINVVDDTAPLIPEAPMDITVACLDEVPPGMDLTATDECQGEITASPEDAITNGDCTNELVIERTWTFVDNCGNSSSVSQTITVKDETAPVAPTPPADVKVSCADEVPPAVDLTAMDNCDDEIMVSPTEVTTEGACANDYTIVRTWTFTDGCGNTSKVSQKITVKDETAPVAPTPPADVKVSCADEVPPAVDLTAMDNCDDEITVSSTEVKTPGLCANDFVLVRTWTFTDGCGNTSKVSQKITVKDETAPVAPNPPADVKVSCADEVPPAVDLTAMDNCDDEITVSPTEVKTPGLCANDFILVRTWTFTDDCGNTSKVSQKITVKDETAPVTPTPPADVKVSCADEVPPAVDLTAMDNCDDEITVSPTEVKTPGLCANDFILVRTWTFTDGCGNTSKVSQKITVKDETAPAAPTPPADVKVSCADEVPPAVDLTAMDNCDDEITVSPTEVTTEGDCANEYTIVRTWTFTDDCGNSCKVSQKITVKDETAPVAPTPPADVEVSCADEVPPAVDLTAMDNCDDEITVSPTEVTTEGACANEYTIVRTWTFTDDCGNSCKVSQKITVKDETAPVAPNPPSDVKVSCADEVPLAVDLTATDNCDDEITVSPTEVTTEGDCANDYTIVRTWTFTDGCGNTSKVSQKITVKDETAPVAPNPPADVKVSCADEVPPAVDLTAMDNCDDEITVSPTEVTTEGDCANDYTIVRTWTFMDDCGNTSKVSQKITVKDETAPVAPNPPADVKVSCADEVPLAVDLTAMDNCDDEITVSPTEVKTPGLCANDFILVRTWTFTDGCGNTSKVSQKITVKDETAPVAPNPPADVKVSCADEVPLAVDLTAMDNCDDEITVSPTEVKTPGLCVNDFILVRTWTFTDGCGNTSKVSQKITVKDETAPVAPNPPADVKVSCADEVPPSVDLTAMDNCDDEITVSPTEVTTEGDCANEYTIVRTWTFTDDCGNSCKVSQKITVKDETAPVAPNPPADVKVSCADEVPLAVDLTATDNCDDEITVSPTEVKTPGLCANDFILVRTWTFTDGCGNTSKVSQKITVKDETAPVAPNPPADVKVSCADEVPAPVDLTAMDNCDDEITVSPTEVKTPGLCANDYTIVRTWTFTDGCGNTSKVSQKITVKDETAPVAPTPPADVKVSCADEVPLAVDLTATDNCDDEITVSPTEVTTEGDCANDYTIVRTWTFTDGCGNTSKVSQKITVKDETAPVAPAPPADVKVSCVDEVPPTVDLTAMDNCDDEITVSPTEVKTPGLCANDFILVRTWTFTDGCGNISKVSQKITVKDETAPVAPNPPADVKVSCADEVPAAVDLTTMDNCDDEITVSPTEVKTPGLCANDFILVRTWTFTDGCGNTSKVSQKITVKDETAPVAPNPPADVKVSCADEVPPAVDLTAMDNCDDEITVSPTEVTTEGACANDYTIVRTWTFTDGCGNTSKVSQTITVKDETAPVAPTPPADVKASCADEVPAPVDLTAMDNCDDEITVSPTEVTTEGACANDYTIVRTWTFTDGCGNTSQVSQTITVKDETAPATPEAPADMTVSCAQDIPEAVDLTAWDACNGAITVSPLEAFSAPGVCANDITLVRTWVFVDACGNASQVSQTITVKDETPPQLMIPLGLDNLSCVDDIPPVEEVMELVQGNVVDGCLSGLPTVELMEDSGPPACVGGIFARTYSLEVCDPCGNCVTYQMTYSGACGEFCTLTQGGWGNAGGKYPWPDNDGKATTTEIITALLNHYGPVVIGDPLARSLTVADPECVLALLPGGGPSGILPSGNNVANVGNDCTPFDAMYLNKQGRLRNNLAAQTIALQLNIWYSALAKGTDLGGLSGGGACLPLTWDGLPASVVTIQDLLDFTNLFLSGQGPTDKTLAGSLTSLVSGVNEYFDGCRLPAVFEGGTAEEDPVPGTGEEETDEEEEEVSCVQYCAPDEASWDSGAKYAWKNGTASTALIIDDLLDKYGDLILGDPQVRSLTVKDADCVRSLLPGTGKAEPLPEGKVVAKPNKDCIVYQKKDQNKDGRLKNILATQTMVLQLNSWYITEMYDTDLGAMLLGSECLPVGKVDLMPSISSVQDLLDYANLVLSGKVGGDYTNLYLTGQIPANYDLPGELAESIIALNAYLQSCGGNPGSAYQEPNGTDLREVGASNLADADRTMILRPNPASSQLEIRYRTELEGKVQLRITDLRGRLVFESRPVVDKGLNSIRLNVSDFSSGLFIVSVMQDSELLQQKLVIVRN